MRQIDLESWPRREQFRIHSAFADPHFGLSANVDVSAFYRAVNDHDISFTVAIVYALARAANSIPQFCRGIREDTVVEHDAVHPSIAVLTNNYLFSFLRHWVRRRFLDIRDALMDRIHIGRSYERVQKYMTQPEEIEC